MSDSTKQNKSSIGKILLIILVVLIVLSSIAYGLYGMYFQFNDQDVSDYIAEEVAGYPADKQAAATKIIRDGVKDILKNRDLSNQVLTFAEQSGTPREMELVHLAVLRAQQIGYLTK